MPTLVCILPFIAVWSGESGIWIPILKTTVLRLQSVAALTTQVIEISRLNQIGVVEWWSGGVLYWAVLSPLIYKFSTFHPKCDRNFIYL